MAINTDPVAQIELEGINETLSLLKGADPEYLTERKELGELNFQEIRPLVENTLSLAIEFLSLPIWILPTGMIQGLSSNLGALKPSMDKLVSFSLSPKFPLEVLEPDVSKKSVTELRSEVLDEAKSACNAFTHAVLPMFSYLKFNSESFKQLNSESSSLLEKSKLEIREQVSAAKSELTGEVERLRMAGTEAEAILQAMKKAAATTGMNQHSTKFGGIAATHKKASWGWLVITVGLVGAIAGSSWYFLSHYVPEPTLSTPALIQRIVAKLVFLSALYFAAVAALRNYRSNRHLVVINEHRQTALQTFEEFVKGTSDEATKNAVLLDATRCIFAPVTTGYLGGEEDNSPNRIVEILKLVGNSK